MRSTTITKKEKECDVCATSDIVCRLLALMANGDKAIVDEARSIIAAGIAAK